MKKFTLTHEINCPADEFWKVFFDNDFNVSLFRDGLGFPEFEIVEQDETDSEIRRTVRGMPKMDAPGPVKKLLGESFRYEESGAFDRASGKWEFKMKPSTLQGKLRTEGSVRCESISDTKCRRVAEIICEAKIFGVGGLVETFTEKEMRKGWDASAVFMNRWLKDKAAD